MKTITKASLALALLAACGTETDPTPQKTAWKLKKTIALPTGAALSPTDPAKPGAAKPQGVAVGGGKVFVSLTNLDPETYAAAGPGAVAIVDQATGAVEKTVSLAVQDTAACFNAGALTVSGDRVFVACAGSWMDDGAVASFKFDGSALTLLEVGGAPGSLAVAGDLVWVGDMSSGSLLAAKKDLSEVVRGKGAAAPAEVCPVQPGASFTMVSDVTVVGATGYAACLNNDQVQPFDAGSGDKKHQPLDVGDGPQALAHLADGAHDLLLVLDGIGGTLSTITTGEAPAASKAVLPLGQVPQGVAVKGSTIAVTNSGDGTVTFLKPTATGFEKTDSVSVKPAEGGATTSPWGVALTETAAFAALNTSNELAILEAVQE